MQKIRFISLAFIGFCTTLVSAFFTPGTFINRTIATAMCTLLSFQSSFCAANLSLLSDRVMAANPPVTERKIADNFANLLADRSREFDDDSSPSSNGGSVAPAYPQQPSPNTPLRRPDFDDDDSNSNGGVNLRNLDIPNDFIVVRQTPMSSGKREVVLKSTSTNIEQIYLVTPAGSEEFEIFEAELRNLSTIDEPLLQRFKIIFNKNTPSKVFLADGTSVAINSNQAVITSPKGKVETVPIKQSSSNFNSRIVPDNPLLNKKAYISNYSKANKLGSFLLADNTSYKNCKANVDKAYTGIGSALIAISAVLLQAPNQFVKLAGYGLATAGGMMTSSQAIKDEASEAFCLPPVYCDQQVVSGGQGVYSNIYQINQAESRGEIYLEYEFYDVPDMLEIFYDGQRIFKVGFTSGNGRETIPFKGTAGQVGVTVTGNTNEPTKWVYKISCPNK
ncbi:hypothetical protein H6G93_18635 [Nostoc sp. FACHB-973]|nr:hypothetical protein [Nostoc sp. FACHB-973]